MGGIVLGDVVYRTVAIAGFAAIAQAFAGLLLLVKITGGACLIHLALNLWTGPTGPSRIAASRGRTGLGTLLTGFSPIIFHLAPLPTMLDPDQIDLAQGALLVAIAVSVLVAILTPYALLATPARGLMQSQTALRLTDTAPDQPRRSRHHRRNGPADRGAGRSHPVSAPCGRPWPVSFTPQAPITCPMNARGFPWHR